MNKRDFDKIDEIAREALKDFKADYNPQDWLEFEQQLNAETSVDDLAQESLKELQVPFDESAWKEFETKLDNKEHLYPYIWRLKGMEVGIIALFIFTFVNLTVNNKNNSFISIFTNDNTSTLTPNSNSDNNVNAEEATEDETFNLADPQALLNQNASENGHMNETNAYDNNDASTNNNHSGLNQNAGTARHLSDNNSNVANYNNANQETPNTYAFNKANNNGNGNINTPDATNFNSNASNNSNAIAPSNANINANDVANESEKEADGVDVEFSEENLMNTINEEEELHELGNSTWSSSHRFLTNEIFAFDSDNNKLNNKHTDPLFELKNVEYKQNYLCKIHVGATVSADANMTTSMGGTSIGYSGGLFFDIECSPRIFIKTGLSASHKKYFDDKEYILDRTAFDNNIYSIKESKTSNLVLVQVPVDFNYIFFKNEKWRIFVSAGITANLVAGRIYEGTQSTSYNGLSIKTDINNNDFDRGALEGGQFIDNLYLSVGGGVGLERQLGDNVSLYLLPIYKHGVTPFGKNKDLIGTFSLNVGVKTTLR